MAAWKGTAAQRQAWAIKKRKERESAAAGAGSQPLPGYQVAPNDHRCGHGDIEKPTVAMPPPPTRCRVCGRTWSYYVTKTGWLVMDVFPITKKMPPDPRIEETPSKVP